jgi:hypothetical protein
MVNKAMKWVDGVRQPELGHFFFGSLSSGNGSSAAWRLYIKNSKWMP